MSRQYRSMVLMARSPATYRWAMETGGSSGSAVRKPSVSASSTTQVSLPPNTAPVSMAMRLWRTTGDFHRGVAVHDDGAEISLRVEERLAGPQQVVAGLVFQGDTRADAGVDEGIAALAVHQDQIAKEVLVRSRDHATPTVRGPSGSMP